MPSKKEPVKIEFGDEVLFGKYCCDCGFLKSFDMYPKNPQKTDGFSSYCKVCKSERDKRHYDKNKEKIKARVAEQYHEKMKDFSFVLSERERSRRKHEKHGHKYNAWYRNKYHNDPEFLAHKKEKDADWRANNKLKIRLRASRRRFYLRNLPSNYEESDWHDTMEHFSNSCALTKTQEDITLEHFIPLATGHGGHVKGNIYPATAKINLSKSSRNPFKWYEERKNDFNINQEDWDRLLEYLSSESGLTIVEFKRYVEWCFENKRKSKEISPDKTSIELWRESPSE